MSPQISPTGNISEQVGPLTVGANPLTQSAGVSASTNVIDSGDVNLDVSVGAGFGPGSSGFGVTPNLQFGQGAGAQTGSQLGGSGGGLAGGLLGGPLGAAGGALVGSGVGSLIGGAFGGSSKKHKEHKSRNGFIDRLQSLGLFDNNYQLSLPDGSIATFDGGAGQTHAAKDPSKLVGEKRGELFGFETDYTNDLDYVASMGGITLARMLGGGKDKSIDQTGNLIGNQALGKVGYGQDFNPQNFNVVIDNLRAMYAQSGIKSKDEFMSLSNEAFGQARFNDADRAVAQQVADLIFDKDFGKASALMAGRWKGLGTAAETPDQGAVPRTNGRPANRPGRIHSPVISFEEALLSVKPIVDYARSVQGKRTGPSSTQQFINDIRGGADIIKGVGGLYNAVNDLTDGGISDFIGGLFDGGESGTSDLTLDPTMDLDIASDISDVASDIGDFELPDFSFSF